MNPMRFTVSECDVNLRLDQFLSLNQDDFTRSGLRRMFDAGKILVNDTVRPKNYKLRKGDVIVLIPLEICAESRVKPQDLTLEILYEDAHLLVVNKKKGMAVHPSDFDKSGTLANALLFHCGGKLSDIGGGFRPGIVHRIDKDTSGLLVAAKTNEAHENLAAQAKAHTMLRVYEGVVCGSVKDDEGIIDAPIARHRINRTKFCVPKDDKNARHAVTHYRTIRRFNRFTHIEFTLETGRTHQIRVHMAYIGHAVAGDMVYGNQKAIKHLNGQCLHAKTLGFTHPTTGERLVFESELPEYFSGFLNRILGEYE